MTKKELIKEEIRYLRKEDLFSLYNDYALANGYNLVYHNNTKEITDYFDNDLYAYLKETSYSKHYDINDEFFTFDGYSRIKSFNDLEDEIDFDDLTNWIVRNNLYDEYSHLFDFDECCEDLDLPSGETFDLRDLEPYADNQELEEIITDMLSNKYGYCINSFHYFIENERVIIHSIIWDTDE
jgi:hypothetical protein